MGPVTSNHIFGIRSDVMLQLLRIQARKSYPMADENQIKQLVPLLLQQLYEKMQTGDTSVSLLRIIVDVAHKTLWDIYSNISPQSAFAQMLQQLMVLQSELEAPPNYAFNQMVNQMQQPQPIQHPQPMAGGLNPGNMVHPLHRQHIMSNNMAGNPNLYGMAYQQQQQLLQQHQPPPQQMTPQQKLIAEAQNRLLKEEARQQLASRMPPPSANDTVIELD